MDLELEMNAFCNNLVPSIKEINEGRNIAFNILSTLKQNSKYEIDRTGIFGSVEKNTMIKIDYDFDCVCFVNVLPPFDDLLKHFEYVLNQTIEYKNAIIIRNDKAIHVMINNFKFDIVPAVNFHRNVEWQRREIMKRMSILPHPSSNGHLFGSSLDEIQAQFIREQSEFAHKLMRICKFWDKTLYIPSYFPGRSSMVEIIALYVANIEEKKYSIPFLRRAFGEFLKLMTNIEKINIVFEKFYSKKDVREDIINQSPLILDPSNPYNNFGHHFIVNGNIKEVYQQYASETLFRLELYTSTKDINAIFLPQPKFVSFKDVKRSLPPLKNWLLQICEFKNEIGQIILRREINNNQKLGFEIMIHYLFKNPIIFNNNSNNFKNIEWVVVNFVSRNIMLEKSYLIKLQNCNISYRDYDVTLKMPAGKFLVIISAKWN